MFWITYHDLSTILAVAYKNSHRLMGLLWTSFEFVKAFHPQHQTFTAATLFAIRKAFSDPFL